MTVQIPDTLHYRGKILDVCDDILGDYLEQLDEDQRPTFGMISTACYRRYFGTWEIRDNILHLVNLEAYKETSAGSEPLAIADAFPGAGDSLAATWFSGSIRCPEGRIREYRMRHAWGSLHEWDHVLSFDEGRLTSEHLVLNPPPPIAYEIAPDGSRTCVSHDKDPLEGKDLRDAHLAWGVPLPDDAEEEYVVPAALFF